ncbi:MAG: ATP-binding cassette domain-containing protein [Pseudomonadota bacterium]
MAIDPSKPVVSVNAVSLELPARYKHNGIETNASTLGGVLVRKGRNVERVRVLDNISFEVNQGTSIGVVGLNGSGKSTLLRVLAGIYAPTAGDMQIQGRISTLFSNQLGMMPNATGAENIQIMARLMGLQERLKEGFVEDVAEFSGLGEYINLPSRTYSAGMTTRIGFGVATSAEPDVLLIDEVFGTGDQSFVDKARKRLGRLIERSGVVLMATHSPSLIRQYCTHAVWLERGTLMMYDKLEAVLDEYRSHVAATKSLEKEAQA